MTFSTIRFVTQSPNHPIKLNFDLIQVFSNHRNPGEMASDQTQSNGLGSIGSDLFNFKVLEIGSEIKRTHSSISFNFVRIEFDFRTFDCLYRCHSDMCSPVMCPNEHISLVICVSPVGKHKTPKLCIQASKWFQSDQKQNTNVLWKVGQVEQFSVSWIFDFSANQSQGFDFFSSRLWVSIVLQSFLHVSEC